MGDKKKKPKQKKDKKKNDTIEEIKNKKKNK